MTDSPEATNPSNLSGNSKHVWLLALVVSLATALAIISPYCWKGNASGHDFSFHAASWMEAAGQWRDGILYPRWADGANFGFGEPRFIFYPPLSWMFGAALSFVVPWLYVPAVFIVLTQTLAGLSAFALGRRLFPQRGALFCVVCYAANPYALLIVYMRSDFAEQLALVFFPVLIFTALELTGAVQARFGTLSRRIVFLAIVFAAIWLTNAPAGVIASYGLTVFFVWRAISQKSCRPLLYGAAGLALGLGLVGFYLVPAAYEQRWVNISQALASGLQPAQNFLYAVIADQEHNAFNHIASNAAVLMIALTGIFAWTSFPRDKRLRSEPLTKAVWSGFLVLAITSAVLMVRVSSIFWTVLPKLRFVQFPWRWMSLLAIPFACFAAATMARSARRYWAALLATALAAVLGCTAAWMVGRTWWDSEDVPVLREAIDKDEGFEGVDEYDPKGDDHADLPEKSARIKLLNATQKSGTAPAVRIHVERWSAERKEVRITAREPVRVALRILNYPAWLLEVNDAVVIPERTEENDQMVVPLAAGSSNVVVRFTRTPDRTIGAAVTLGSMLIAIFIFFRRERT